MSATSESSNGAVIDKPTKRIVGHVLDVIEPRKQRDGGSRFFGFILSDKNEKFYFRCADLLNNWPSPATQLVNKIVAFEAIVTPPHEMRQAVNIDIISGVAA